MDTELERLAAVRRMCRSGEARRCREEAQLSIPELARALGVAPLTVQRWEVGTRRPRRDAALRYLNILETIARAAA